MAEQAFVDGILYIKLNVLYWWAIVEFLTSNTEKIYKSGHKDWLSWVRDWLYPSPLILMYSFLIVFDSFLFFFILFINNEFNLVVFSSFYFFLFLTQWDFIRFFQYFFLFKISWFFCEHSWLLHFLHYYFFNFNFTIFKISFNKLIIILK